MKAHRTFFISAALGAALTFVPAGARAAWFMKMDAIAGNASDQKHQGWIELTSFSWGATQSAQAGAMDADRSMSAMTGMRGMPMKATGASAEACSGASGGGNVSITKSFDAASPKLAQALARGTPLGDVVVEKTGADGGTLTTYTLSNVLISGHSTSSGGDRPTESIALNYTRIVWSGADCGDRTNPSMAPTRQTAPSHAP